MFTLNQHRASVSSLDFSLFRLFLPLLFVLRKSSSIGLLNDLAGFSWGCVCVGVFFCLFSLVPLVSFVSSVRLGPATREVGINPKLLCWVPVTCKSTVRFLIAAR